MRGAIIGDIIGSAFIESPQPVTEIQLLKPSSAYTDDTILTLAMADAVLNHKPYEITLKEWVRLFPKAGYKQDFLNWALSDKHHSEYDSQGDGAARRISPIGFSAHSLEEAIEEAKRATYVTHASKSKIKDAQLVAGSIFLAKEGHSKEQIGRFLSDKSEFEVNPNNFRNHVEMIADKCNTPVPFALLAFFDSTNFEDALRKAITIGGPTNTIASITGALAQAYYKHIPKCYIRKTLSRVEPNMNTLIKQFEAYYFNDQIQSGQRALKFVYA
ncbi:MAG: ADP-ribosylglycohydrolase family protein [Marinilabiliaceae bacterium]|nr:ADP-ribosylglycohydrolase family protein [Marinilabiliaceae bacterium]